jgi:hypothetical protein
MHSVLYWSDGWVRQAEIAGGISALDQFHLVPETLRDKKFPNRRLFDAVFTMSDRLFAVVAGCVVRVLEVELLLVVRDRLVRLAGERVSDAGEDEVTMLGGECC